jgi:hypothetical protein
MADIGPRDELYMVDPKGKMEKMDPNEHHLEHLMSIYPDEEDYNEDFWNTIFEGGWIRIELRENHRNGWDLALNGNNLYRMKAIVRDKFLERLGRGENKVHIEEWTGSGFNPTHIFYLPAQKHELFDFLFEKFQAKFISEALDFERGINPKEAMTIGTEAQKKKLDKETDWGFEFSPAFYLKTFDIIKYEGFLIKVVQVMGSDGIAYYATLNNTGEPYNNTPPLYDTPEEALDWEQKYIDQYNMGL